MADDLAPAVRAPDRDEIRRLAEHGDGDAPVLTIYLDLDPERFSTAQARQSQVTSLMDDARRRAEGSSLDHDAKEMLCKDIEALRDYCTDSLPVDGGEAIALFRSSAKGLFDVVPLPRSVEPNVTIGDAPYIEPLAVYIATERWVVALVNRTTMRMLVGDGNTFEETRAIRDTVHRQHSQGGWSQARYERSVEQDVHNHLERVGSDLLATFERAPFEHLVIGALPEFWPQIEAVFHPYLMQRVRARIDIDVEHSSLDEICDAVRPVVSEHQKEREAELLARFQQELGRGERAAAGRPDVLKALDERRVEVLMLAERPSEGSERAIDLALRQSADVVVISHHEDLEHFDGIGALLRF